MSVLAVPLQRFVLGRCVSTAVGRRGPSSARLGPVRLAASHSAAAPARTAADGAALGRRDVFSDVRSEQRKKKKVHHPAKHFSSVVRVQRFISRYDGSRGASQLFGRCYQRSIEDTTLRRLDIFLEMSLGGRHQHRASSYEPSQTAGYDKVSQESLNFFNKKSF